MPEKAREVWVDVVKGIAILAVLLDHTIGGFFAERAAKIVDLTFFSVSLFVLVGGYNAARSQDRRREDGKAPMIQWHGVMRLLTAYAVATAVFMLYNDHVFDLPRFIVALVSFNINGPFYFVAFYLQLLVFAPVLYMMSRKRPLLFSVVVFLLAHLFTRHTYVTPAYGAGKCLMGGYFLFTFYLGILAARVRLTCASLLIATGAILGIAYIVLGMGSVRAAIVAVNGKVGYIVYLLNPSGLRYLLGATAIFLAVKGCAAVLDRHREMLPVHVVSTVGRESMVVFLYHILVFLVFCKFVESRSAACAIVCIVLEIALPVMGIMAFRLAFCRLKEELS